MKRLYRKSLKKRISNALMKSSLLSIAITVVAMIVFINVIMNPIGTLLTNSINNGIVESYNRMSEDYGRENGKGTDMFKDTPYGALKNIDFANKASFVKQTPEDITEDEILEVQASVEFAMQHSLYVSGTLEEGNAFTDDEKKQLLLSSIQALESFDKFLVMGEMFGFDWFQITLYLEEDEIEFQVPKGNISEGMPTKKHSLTDEVMIYDMNDELVGVLVTELNSGIVFIATTPIIFLLILIALVTFIIVRILLGPSTYKLVKPVNTLNKQLKCISENEVIDSTVHIEMKKPPKEIYELIKYSNIIMGRLNESQELLFAQNQELEAQRDVLEAQRDELESQRDELEAQNEELDTQNDELMTSQLELKKAQDRLVQSEKLASMGQLTAAIAHEINTPLGAVSSNSQMVDMILMKLTKAVNEGDTDAALKTVDKLKSSNSITIDAANRVNEIIRNLRNFSRIDQAEFQNADVNEGIKSVLVLTSNLWKNKLTINENYGELPDISCYPSMLNQVFMNVIVNAIQATEKNGHIDILSRVDEDHIVIKVKDDGEGIPEALLYKVFDSGFTTKPKDAGTGLGLSISRDIINKHHGKISAYNNEEKGCTFEIRLPISQVKHDETCEHD